MCTFTCMKGYRFPNASIQSLNLACKDGKWTSTNKNYAEIPACSRKHKKFWSCVKFLILSLIFLLAICLSECMNGGSCVSPNVCQCAKEFRGPQCQYSVENCSPKKISFNGGYNCTGSSEAFSCKLYCPKNVNFEFEPASVYTCKYSEGEFNPKNVPKCLYGKLCYFYNFN